MVRKIILFHPLQRGFLSGDGDFAVCQIVAAANDLLACDLDELHRLGFARLEPHRGAGGDVETFAVSQGAIKLERGIGLDEMVVAADLNRAVPEICHRQGRGLAAGVEFDFAVENLGRWGSRSLCAFSRAAGSNLPSAAFRGSSPTQQGIWSLCG